MLRMITERVAFKILTVTTLIELVVKLLTVNVIFQSNLTSCNVFNSLKSMNYNKNLQSYHQEPVSVAIIDAGCSA